MRRHLSFFLGAAIFVIGGTAGFSAERPKGYLAPGEFDVTPVLEPAPRHGDPRYDTDRKIFRATRKFVGSPRWTLATNDADFRVPALLHDFSCSVGVTMTPDNSPRLVALLSRASFDTSVQTSKAKDYFQRERPFTIDHGAICQPSSELYDARNHRMSYDYPSGHTTLGWTWALILSNLAPDRAQQILERGRAYGDSRFICGAHNESAVEAGIMSASTTMALVETKPEFLADAAAARAELSALRTTGTPPSDCAAEASLLRERVMPNLH